jgi:L-threonylcarbamoyladenylate synthase
MRIIKRYDYHTVLKSLSQGGLVIFPSDTVYGALVDATNHMAVSKLIELKNRPYGKPISVFVTDFKMMEDLVFIRKSQKKVINSLLPGAYTVVLPSRHRVDKRLESEKGTLGIRYPRFEPINYLVSLFKRPVTATSANISGRPPCHSIEAFLNQLSKKKTALIDLIVDQGKLPPNKPSTVVDLSGDDIRILRLGDVAFSKTKTYVSFSESETKNIAKNILHLFLSEKKIEKKPLIFIIEGDLGAGKTIFVKGLASDLGIVDIISPSFVIYYEYQVDKNLPVKKLIHADLYHLQESEEFKYLNLERYLKPGNLLCIEWGEKIGQLYEHLKEKGEIVYIKIEYLDEKKRKLTVKN